MAVDASGDTSEWSTKLKSNAMQGRLSHNFYTAEDMPKQAPLDTDERYLTISKFHDVPLNAKTHSPHMHPAIGQRGELDNDCPYLHHPWRRLDLEDPLALRPILESHSP